MLKSLFCIFIILVACFCSGCSNDLGDSVGAADAGFITPHVYVTGDDAPDAASFSLSLTDGSAKEHTWTNIGAFSTKQGFRPGRYVMSASYGAENSEGFGKPYYTGSTSFDVISNETVDVAIHCKRLNVAVSLDIEESFSSRMRDYRVIFHSEGGSYFEYASESDGPLYVRAGEVEMFLHFTLADGSSTSVLLYRLQASEGENISCALSADDNAVMLDAAAHGTRVLELTSELFSASAPDITPTGFMPETPLPVVEGVTPAEPVVFHVTSSHPLGEVVFTVQPPSLLALGIAREINLLDADASVMEMLRQYGAICAVSNDGKSLTLDITGLLTHLKAADMPAINDASRRQMLPTFSLIAINDLGQVSLPVTLKVDLRPMEIEALPPDRVEAGASTATVRVKATSGEFVNHLGIFTSDDGGDNWTHQTVIRSTMVSDGLYEVTFSLPESLYPSVKVRMDYLGQTAASFDLYFTTPPYTIDVDGFASHLAVRINGESPQSTRAIASSAYVYVNGTPANIYMRDADNGLVYVTGLTPSTTYDVASTIFRHPDSDDFTPSVRVTTEDVIQLPNGAFEETEEVINWEDLPMGGLYSQNAMPLFNRQNRADVTASQPKAPWASVNDKTFYLGASNPNTWYMQPSTMESANIISGAVSIKLVSVAFDPAGVKISPYRQVSAPFIDYNHNIPNIRYRAAGKIFLGSYAYNGSEEEYQQGYPFASRPSAINGIYRYYPGGGSPEDCGRVDVSLWGTVNGQYRELTHATGKLYPSATNASFSVPIRYPIFGAKASTIMVMISSSYDIGDIEYESQHIVTTPDARTATSLGSILEVDELTLSY